MNRIEVTSNNTPSVSIADELHHLHQQQQMSQQKQEQKQQQQQQQKQEQLQQQQLLHGSFTEYTTGDYTDFSEEEEGSSSSAIDPVCIVPSSSSSTTRSTIIKTKTLTKPKKRVVYEVSMRDIELDKFLGSGTFASVYTVKASKSASSPVSSWWPSRSSAASSKTDTETTLSTTSDDSAELIFGDGDAKITCSTLALKRINSSSLESEKRTRKAIRGLIKEVDVLSKLPSHDNIIGLYAVSAGFPQLSKYPSATQAAAAAATQSGDMFVILERLVSENLDERLERWRREHRNRKERNNNNEEEDNNSSSKLLGAFFQNRQQKSMQRKLKYIEQRQRIKDVALGIAEALAFIHSRGILYRDVKAANVGFDAESNRVKIFDFGLAKRIGGSVDDDNNNADKDDPAMKRLNTRFVGTPCYMAPEVAMTKHYGYSADVHSFSILLWEIVTLHPAYSDITSLEELIEYVVHRGMRPPLSSIKRKSYASKHIKTLLRAGWHADPKRRPTMEEIVIELKQIIENN